MVCDPASVTSRLPAGAVPANTSPTFRSWPSFFKPVILAFPPSEASTPTMFGAPDDGGGSITTVASPAAIS